MNHPEVVLSPKPIAVLSTVVIPVDGTYRVETISTQSGLSALEAHCQEDGPILHYKSHKRSRQTVTISQLYSRVGGTYKP